MNDFLKPKNMNNNDHAVTKKPEAIMASSTHAHRKLSQHLMFKKLSSKLKAFVQGAAIVFAAGTPVMADDIDIYTGAIAVGGLGGDPSLLVLLDSSGSMQFDMFSNTATGSSGGTDEYGNTVTLSGSNCINGWSCPSRLRQRRIFHMQDAVRTLISMAPGKVKLGLHNYSGGVDPDYEAKLLSTVVGTASTAGTISATVENSGDDVTQEGTSAAGFNTGSSTVRFGELKSTPGGTQTLSRTFFVNGGDDDASECWGDYASNALYIPRFANVSCFTATGLRFTGFDLPPNSTVTDANLVLFHSQNTRINSGSAVVRVENNFNAANYWNQWWLTSRDNNVIGGSANFNLGSGWRYRYNPEVVDVTGLIQNVMVNANYASRIGSHGSANLSMFITGTSVSTAGNGSNRKRRRFYARESGTFYRPRLNIDYSATVPGTAGAVHRAGLHYRNLDIPQGATITSASIRVRASQTSHRDDAAFRLSRNSSPTPDDFSTTNDLANTTHWVDGTNFRPSSWNNNQWYSFNIAGMVQNHVNNGSWSCGNDMAFLLEDNSSYSNSINDFARIHTNESGHPAQLHITYTLGASGNSCKTVNSETRFRGEDVQEKNGTVTTFEQTLSVQNNHFAGLRFTNIELQKNDATTTTNVRDARLTLTAGNSTGAVPNFNIQVTADPFVVFGNKANAVSSEPLISSTAINWTPSGWSNGQRYTSPDIGSLIQMVLDSDAWEYGASIGVVITSTNNSPATIRSWDHESTNPAIQLYHYGNSAPELTISTETTDGNNYLTHRENLYDYIDNFIASGGTPLIDSYGEGMEYMLGDGVINTSENYVSPIDSSAKCAPNHYILVTDGDPSGDNSNDVDNMLSHFSQGSISNNWDAAQRLARFLSDDNGLGAHADGGFTIKTHAISLGQGVSTEAELEQLAIDGQGEFKSADNAADLITAFESVVGQIADNDSSIAIPGVSVNQANRFQHLDELYYAVFKPSSKVRWYGNIKRYQIDQDVNDSFELFDVSGSLAVDPATQFFSNTSKSWWSHPVTDGSTVLVGGAAQEMPQPADRLVLTYTGSYGSTPTVNADLVPSGAPNTHRLDANNASHNGGNITQAMTGVAALPLSANEKQLTQEAVLNWGAGFDTQTENGVGPNFARERWGAAIHASPLLVNYDSTGTHANNTVFIPTNEGFLHAVYTGESNELAVDTNNTGGKEIFAWMPQELLPKLTDIYDLPNGDFEYGLDSSWVSYRNDANGDGKIAGADEWVYIYGGMRRGGRNYYSLDVSNSFWLDTNNDGINDNDPEPVLKWAIRGGVTPGFNKLGQTWARPVLRRIPFNNANGYAEVAFLSGGYNENHDVQGFTGNDTIGNAVYIVNVDTGQLLWSTSNNSSNENNVEMNNAIVSEVKTFDRNFDGIVDGFYVMDIVGKLFRYEINENPTSAGDFIDSVKFVAELGNTAPGASGAANNRRFYESPSVAPTPKGDYVIAAVSGYRASPLDEATDEKMFFIVDEGAAVKPSVTNSTRHITDLLDVTNEANVPSPGDSNYADFISQGWHIDLPGKAEKGIGAPDIFNGAIFFTTFENNTPAGAGKVCSPVIGRSNLYVLNFDSTGAIDPTGTNPQKKISGGPGLTPGTQTVFVTDDTTGDTKPVKIFGTIVIDEKDLCPPGSSNCVLLPEGLGDVSHLRWYQQ